MSEFITLQANWDTGTARVVLDDFATTDECVRALCELLIAVGFARESVKASLEEAARGL